LYINEKWGVRARTPNLEKNKDIEWLADKRLIKISKGNISQWKNFNKVEMVTLNAWTGNHLRLKAFTADSLNAFVSIQKEEECVFRVAAFAFHGKEYFFENAFEFLDSGGEWYLNSTDGYLYYKPRANENMANAEIIAPVLDPVVKIEGESFDNSISNISFKGISFMHSNWLRPNNFGNVEMQAAQFFMPDAYSTPGEFTGRPSAGVLVKNAHHIVFERCLFANMGATGLDFISGTHDNLVIGNVFRDIAGNGVSFGLTPKENEVKTTIYRPSDVRKMPVRETVLNNYFTRVGKDNIGAVGIMYAYAANMKISHNEMEDIPYTGISGGWGWDFPRTAMCNNVITNNYIHNYMNVFYDGGGIYTFSNQPNSLIANNYIENMRVGARGYGWCGLYTDEGTRHMTVKSNVVEVQQDEKIGWLCLQSVGQGALECPVINNYTTSTSKNDNKGQPIVNTHYYPKADWPKAAREIISNAGLSAEFKDIKEEKKKLNLNTNQKRPANSKYPLLPKSRLAQRGQGNY